MSVLDHITSFVDGRVRLRHPALKDAATAELVCSVVGAVDGISAVQSNPRTGSLLIYYDAEKLTREQLLELAEQGAAFIPGMDGEGAPAEAADVWQLVPWLKWKRWEGLLVPRHPAVVLVCVPILIRWRSGVVRW